MSPTEEAIKNGLRFICPMCSRKLASVPFQRYETQVLRRKCRGCGKRWQLKVVPLQIKQGVVHSATFSDTTPRKRIAGGRFAVGDLGTI